MIELTKKGSSTIFDLGTFERRAHAQRVAHIEEDSIADLPQDLLRTDVPALPEVSELQAVRHYNNL